MKNLALPKMLGVLLEATIVIVIVIVMYNHFDNKLDELNRKIDTLIEQGDK